MVSVNSRADFYQSDLLGRRSLPQFPFLFSYYYCLYLFIYQYKVSQARLLIHHVIEADSELLILIRISSFHVLCARTSGLCHHTDI